MNRATLLGFCAFCCMAMGIATYGAAQEQAAAVDPWCRLDDPGSSEAERRRLNLKSSELGGLACPSRPDPQSRPDQIVLPLPCGRAMVFRKINLPLRTVLDRQEAFFGVVPEPGSEASKPSRVAVSGPREAFVSGSLSLGPKASPSSVQRGFYIGKYEVTSLQYKIHQLGLLTPDGAHGDPADPACAPVIEEARRSPGTWVLPATRINWFDAVGFARAYTEWLLALDRASLASKKAPTALPWEEGTPGFLRLPTAAEWEYAARGGDVAPAAQSSRSYLVNVDGQQRAGTIEEIAAVSSPENAPPDGAEVYYAGRKLPNAFGLYDMVGNAAEVVLDLFQPRRPDGLNGAIGGQVLMGGSAGDDGVALGVGARAEGPLFRADGPVRSPTTGFRLAISAPFFVNKRQGNWGEAIGNPDLDADVDRAYQDILGKNSAPGAADRVTADQLLKQLEEQLTKQKEEAAHQATDATAWKQFTERLQAELSAVKSSLDRSKAAINERQARLQIEQTRSIMLIASNINSIDRQLRVSDQNVELVKQRMQKSSADEQKRIENELRELAVKRSQLARSNDASFRYYVETVRTLAEAPKAETDQAVQAVQHAFATEGNTVLNAFQAVATKHVDSARAEHGVVAEATKRAWLKEILATQRTQASTQ